MGRADQQKAMEVRLERGQTLIILFDDPHSDLVREAWITCEDLDRLMDGVPHGAPPHATPSEGNLPQ